MSLLNKASVAISGNTLQRASSQDKISSTQLAQLPPMPLFSANASMRFVLCLSLHKPLDYALLMVRQHLAFRYFTSGDHAMRH